MRPCYSVLMARGDFPAYFESYSGELQFKFGSSFKRLEETETSRQFNALIVCCKSQNTKYTNIALGEEHSGWWLNRLSPGAVVVTREVKSLVGLFTWKAAKTHSPLGVPVCQLLLWFLRFCTENESLLRHSQEMLAS